MHARRESGIIPSKRWCSVCTRARRVSVNGATRCGAALGGMPNGIANPIQETSGTNGGSMFYRYCSRRSALMYVSSRRYRTLSVLSAVCKRIYGLAFVYRRPCYHFPRRRVALFLPGRSADAREGIKIGDSRKSEEGARARGSIPGRALRRDSSSSSSIFSLSFNRLAVEDERNPFFF